MGQNLLVELHPSILTPEIDLTITFTYMFTSTVYFIYLTLDR